MNRTMIDVWVLAGVLLCGCGGSATMSSGSTDSAKSLAPPVFTTSPAQNGASIVTLTAASGATIYYTLDGSDPTTKAQIYQAPFLVASSLTVKALAEQGAASSSVATRTFSLGIASGTLVWSDEFSNAGSAPAQPDPGTWTYDTGYQCCGNNEQETYCAWASNVAPCNPANPNAFV